MARPAGTIDMEMIIGPILKRAGGYVFDTWNVREGLNPCFSYRRIEDAAYARNVTIRTGHSSLSAIVCHTLDEFLTQTAPCAIPTAA
jgi:hypothetical protein